MVELNRYTPTILIRLIKNNPYKSLIRRIEEYQNLFQYTQQNSLLMDKIETIVEFFFVSFMVVYNHIHRLYTDDHEKQHSIVMTMLLNGCAPVGHVFNELLRYADCASKSELISYKDEIYSFFSSNNWVTSPVIALDECHTPSNMFKNIFLHSSIAKGKIDSSDENVSRPETSLLTLFRNTLDSYQSQGFITTCLYATTEIYAYEELLIKPNELYSELDKIVYSRDRVTVSQFENMNFLRTSEDVKAFMDTLGQDSKYVW